MGIYYVYCPVDEQGDWQVKGLQTRAGEEGWRLMGNVVQMETGNGEHQEADSPHDAFNNLRGLGVLEASAGHISPDRKRSLQYGTTGTESQSCAASTRGQGGAGRNGRHSREV